MRLWDTGDLESVGVHYITQSHTEFKVLYVSVLLNQHRQVHPRLEKQNPGCLCCSWKYENKSSGCVFILESQKNPIEAGLLYVRLGVREYIDIFTKKEGVISLTFILSTLSCVAVTSPGQSRARLYEGLEGNWSINHYIAKEEDNTILSYKLWSIDFSEGSSTWVQLACSLGFCLVLFAIASSSSYGHVLLGYGNIWVKVFNPSIQCFSLQRYLKIVCRYIWKMAMLRQHSFKNIIFSQQRKRKFLQTVLKCSVFQKKSERYF